MSRLNYLNITALDFDAFHIVYFVNDRHQELLQWKVGVVLSTHELHKTAVHSQDHGHIQLCVGEERIAFGHDEVRMRKGALTKKFCVQCADLAF